MPPDYPLEFEFLIEFLEQFRKFIHCHHTWNNESVSRVHQHFSDTLLIILLQCLMGGDKI